MDPTKLEKYFYLIQMILGAILVLGLWFFAQRDRTKSNFKFREADRTGVNNGRRPRLDGPENDKDHEPDAPLQLTGIKTNGPPHEILQVKPKATKKQILTAYRKLMKHYHPDKVGPPGSRQWSDAQEIASAINRAKDEMLKNLKAG